MYGTGVCVESYYNARYTSTTKMTFFFYNHMYISKWLTMMRNHDESALFNLLVQY